MSSFLWLAVEDVKTRACTLRTQYSRLVKPQGSGRKKKPLTLRQKRILRSCEFLKKHISHRSTESNVGVTFKIACDKWFTFDQT